jgi:hypothetical protein
VSEILDDSRLYSETPYSVGHLWRSDELVVETSIRQHTEKRQASMCPADFELAIPTSEPHTHALEI